LYCQKQQNRVLCHRLGALRLKYYMVHLWFVGNGVVDFLLVLIELFCQHSRLRRYEQILVEIVMFEKGWVTLSGNIRGMRGLPPTTLGVRKLESLGYRMVLLA